MALPSAEDATARQNSLVGAVVCIQCWAEANLTTVRRPHKLAITSFVRFDFMIDSDCMLRPVAQNRVEVNKLKLSSIIGTVLRAGAHSCLGHEDESRTIRDQALAWILRDDHEFLLHQGLVLGEAKWHARTSAMSGPSQDIARAMQVFHLHLPLRHVGPAASESNGNARPALPCRGLARPRHSYPPSASTLSSPRKSVQAAVWRIDITVHRLGELVVLHFRERVEHRIESVQSGINLLNQRMATARRHGHR